MVWNLRADVEAVWPEAMDFSATVYDRLFETANALCAAYAPALPEGDPIPESWKTAEVLQARHIWSQNGRGTSEAFGPDGLPVSSYSLVMTARDILRPKSSPLRRVR